MSRHVKIFYSRIDTSSLAILEREFYKFVNESGECSKVVDIATVIEPMSGLESSTWYILTLLYDRK